MCSSVASQTILQNGNDKKKKKGKEPAAWTPADAGGLICLPCDGEQLLRQKTSPDFPHKLCSIISCISTVQKLCMTTNLY